MYRQGVVTMNYQHKTITLNNVKWVPAISQRLRKYWFYTLLEKIAFSLELLSTEQLKKVNPMGNVWNWVTTHARNLQPSSRPAKSGRGRSGHKIRMPNIQTTSHHIHNGTS